MELRDTRLGDAEHLADSRNVELLVVVERHDELSRSASAIASASASFCSVTASGPCGSGALLLFERADRRDRVAVATRHRPRLVSAAIEERPMSSRLSSSWSRRDAELRGDLLVGRRAVRASLQLGDRPLDVARAGPTERGAQSIARSSSMILALMRAIAYVSNLISRVGVDPLDRAHQPVGPYGQDRPRPRARTAGAGPNQRRT